MVSNEKIKIFKRRFYKSKFVYFIFLFLFAFFLGPGGKKHKDETIEQTTIRECEEEVEIKPLRLQKKGILDFHFIDKPSYSNRCHVFICDEYQGKTF